MPRALSADWFLNLKSEFYKTDPRTNLVWTNLVPVVWNLVLNLNFLNSQLKLGLDKLEFDSSAQLNIFPRFWGFVICAVFRSCRDIRSELVNVDQFLALFPIFSISKRFRKQAQNQTIVSDHISRHRKTTATNGQRHSIRRHRNMLEFYEENSMSENFLTNPPPPPLKKT